MNVPRLASILALSAMAACSGAPSRTRAVDLPEAVRTASALPRIPDRTFLLTDFGAVGDGRTLETIAFRNAVAAVEKAGGGRLVVPKGVFRTLPLALCSNLDLHLEDGAVIRAPDTFAELGLPHPASLRSQEEVGARWATPDPLITGKGLHDVATTGTGVIDGNGALWWAWSERASISFRATSPT